ncbi:cytochrome c and c1 heme-lyase [Calocera viscosa TUFC12733]|uniref:Holocytochrome c-type synthase n=1 Tax=Calocera viscosa (strain TUFC12733) TaxID=1330018 RepID=A0A167Q1G3_CALVF|nr:cytochrome c and c1 heme-lyase [Calocera viscosa TUFC12733]
MYCIANHDDNAQDPDHNFCSPSPLLSALRPTMSHPSSSSSTPEQAQCPVDHTTRAAWVEQAEAQCPVDHDTRSAWLEAGQSAPHPLPSSSAPTPSSATTAPLPTDRETSSIPRADASSNWVYPSQSQFFSALSRKHASGAYAAPPSAADMPVVVPIHNAVNERAWGEVLKWEQGMGGDACGGVKLHSFVGKPRERTWRAWGRVLMGYQPPFDRHDWVVDRCGHRVRYIIDFYAGRAPSSSSASGPHPLRENNQVSFFLDVRPAPDSWEGIRMQLGRTWGSVWGR